MNENEQLSLKNRLGESGVCNLKNVIRIFNNKILFELFFVIGTLGASLEFLFSPEPHFAKSLGILPAFDLGGFTITLMELYVSFCIFVSMVIFSSRYAKGVLWKNCSFSPWKVLNYCFLTIVLTTSFSTIMGFIIRPNLALGATRIHFLLLIFPIFLAHRSTIFSFRHLIFRIMDFLGITFSCIAIMTFFLNTFPIPSFLPYDLYVEGLWFGMYLSVFAAVYNLSYLLAYGVSLKPLIVLSGIFVSVVIRITNKPILFCILIGILTVMLMNSRAIRKRFLVFSMILCFFASVIFSVFLHNDFKKDFIQIFAKRFFKIELKESEVVNADFFLLISKLSLISTQKGQDVSGGRFLLWKAYLLSSLEYPILSPFLGEDSVFVPELDQSIRVPPHNIFVYLIFNVGYPAFVSFFIAVFYFFRKGLVIIQQMPNFEVKDRMEAVASFAFLVSIFCAEQIGIVVSRSITFAWFFWSITVIFLCQIIHFRRFCSNKKGLLRDKAY